jgi:hypothetical protein
VNRISLEPESVLEAGFAVLALGCLAGLGLLVGGRLLGEAQRRKWHAEAAPAPASIPAERHQQLSTSAR